MLLSKEVYLMIFEKYDYTSFRDVKSLYFVNKLFKELIESILINISVKNINYKYELHVNDEIKNCEESEFDQFSTLFKDWVISEIIQRKLNNYYKEYNYICFNILVPKSNFSYRLNTFVYHYFDLSNFICNLNTGAVYIIEDKIIFISFLTEHIDLFFYNEVDGKKIFLLSDDFFKIQFENLIEVTSSE
ncbi:15328_t:CDS:1 [Cetraspora pellucida]|uniref:15328_t:CDS:1 n=1 Tax=Cetraspora pellucida TaxID=1433469 RepID=A0ACA9KUD2_9GLOM|nr:15328_t:CDS:1 [Cetraspora pellucida]